MGGHYRRCLYIWAVTIAFHVESVQNVSLFAMVLIIGVAEFSVTNAYARSQMDVEVARCALPIVYLRVVNSEESTALKSRHLLRVVNS